jgi:pepF/M3 family oligoendopeptidase
MADELGPLPRWTLDRIFPGLESPELERALSELDARLGAHEAALDRDGVGGAAARAEADEARLAAIVDGYIERANWLAERHQTLDAYAGAFFSTDTKNEVAKRRASELEARESRLEACSIRFLSWVRALDGRLDALSGRSDRIRAHRFFLEEAIVRSRHLMSEPEEVLASALAPAGASAWRRLHQSVTSQIEVPLERDGKIELLPMSKVRTLAADPDPELRRRAYEAELAAWERWKEPCAAAINGIKGWASTLARRRGYEAPIDVSIEQARMDRETLEALLGAMRRALPDFRRYMKAKARRLGKDRLAWHDIHAPAASSRRVWRYDEAAAFIRRCFASFSPRLEAFAARAVEGGWIDAEPRAGKVGGAFCMPILEAKESRILANYDGTFDQLSTLAHELGHGYHNEVLKDTEVLRKSGTPMTLAETASIFCETIVFNAALAEAAPADQLAILETYLLGANQVVVDIYSRYLFETRLFERRATSELGASELCRLMSDAEVEAYGDALDPARLHPFMWAVKPHYYSADFGFYNYPYAFGLLFGLGLYAIYRRRGPAFCADYDALLGATGLGKAADLAARFGIDIRSGGFWDGGVAQLREFIDRYEKL